jgi:hypothetical protein
MMRIWRSLWFDKCIGTPRRAISLSLDEVEAAEAVETVEAVGAAGAERAAGCKSSEGA